MLYLILVPLLPFFIIQKLLPRNKFIWIYGAWYGRKYNDNSRALFEYVCQNDSDIRSIWLTKNCNVRDYLNKKGYECYLENSLRGIFLSLRAKVIIVSSGKSDVNRFTITGAKVINLWHGAPMKRIGLDDNVVSKRRAQSNREINGEIFWNIIPKYFYPFLYEYNYDYMVSTAPTFSSKLQSAFDMPIDHIMLTGYPRNDMLFAKNKSELAVSLANKYHYKHLFLYLPTFRSGKTLNEMLDDSSFDEVRMNELMTQVDGIFVIKGHFASSANAEDKASRVVVVDDEELFDLNHFMKDADVLLTDYSGCYFDFLLLNKMVIFTPFDHSDYVASDRQLYFNYRKIASGPIANDWLDVNLQILEFCNGVDSFAKRRESLNSYFNYYHDNHSSDRVYQSIKRSVL